MLNVSQSVRSARTRFARVSCSEEGNGQDSHSRSLDHSPSAAGTGRFAKAPAETPLTGNRRRGGNIIGQTRAVVLVFRRPRELLTTKELDSSFMYRVERSVLTRTQLGGATTQARLLVLDKTVSKNSSDIIRGGSHLWSASLELVMAVEGCPELVVELLDKDRTR